MLPANISYNFTQKLMFFLFLRTSPGHLISKPTSHNAEAPRSCSWDVKLTVDSIHVIVGQFQMALTYFLNTTKHMSVLSTWIALEICSLNYSVTWQGYNSLHSFSDSKN